VSGKSELYAGVADVDCSGETVLVTGSTDGIGREAALALGRLGAEVVVHGRSGAKAQRVVDRIQSQGGSARYYTADFASLSEIRSFAETVRDEVGTVDVLANNAGTYFRTGQRTEDRVEATVAVNHLAPFLLTHRLLPSIPEGGRVVTTASSVHSRGELDPDRLDEVGEYDGLDAYARSKLANVLFTRELARRLPDHTANCFHPGLVPGSALWRDAPLVVRAATRVGGLLPDAIARRIVDTPATGAATLVYLAVSDGVEEAGGQYFSNCEPTEPSRTARDDALARRLWERSEEATGIAESARLERIPEKRRRS
jgi:NAD(P)-dependent dehydrogenase (short-subunit alcohol dehydrogenase family)